MTPNDLEFNAAVVVFLVAMPFLFGWLGEMVWAKMRK